MPYIVPSILSPGRVALATGIIVLGMGLYVASYLGVVGPDPAPLVPLMIVAAGALYGKEIKREWDKVRNGGK